MIERPISLKGIIVKSIHGTIIDKLGMFQTTFVHENK